MMLRRRPWLVTTAIAVLLLGGLWGVRVLRVIQSVDALEAYWEGPRGPEGGLVYVALGDSAAQGVGASSPDAGYVGLVADRLRTTTGLPVQIINLSRSGARIADVVRDQVPLLEGQCADLITVGVGGNDIRDYDRARFTADVTALTAGLPPGAVIANVPDFMHGRWQHDAAEGTHLLTTQANARGLVVAEVYQAMRARGWGSMLTDYAADLFHPNDRGHRVWAGAFWTAIEPRVDGLVPGC